MNIFSLQSRGTLCLKAAHRTKSVRTVQNASKGCLFSQKDNLPICSGCILLIYRLFWPHKIFWRKISGERKKKGKPIHDNVILHAFLSIRRSDAADISNVLFWPFEASFWIHPLSAAEVLRRCTAIIRKDAGSIQWENLPNFCRHRCHLGIFSAKKPDIYYKYSICTYFFLTHYGKTDII